MEKNTDGNIWRKWDLHLHTPASLFNNQYGINPESKDQSEQIWDDFVSMIENQQIQVIGATDYYSVDGYEKLLEYKKKGRLANIKAIFPNIEIRLNASIENNRFANYHILFSPETSVSKIRESFLQKLTFKVGEKTYSFIENDLCQLGTLFSENKEIDRKKLYRSGVEQFKVDINQMIGILKADFKGDFFTIAAGDNADGINNFIKERNTNDILSPNQGWATRLNILKYTDALFTTNKRTINIFNGKEQGDFIKEKCNGLKPCFEESDAHKFNSNFGKRWTWVKAEPSFDGLLQTKFESERRVVEERFCLHNPSSIESNHYIKSIEIKDPSDRFQKKIVFNPGLNTIIGGKSSGKSLLLYQLASTCKSDSQLSKIENDMVTPFENYRKLNLKTRVILGNNKEVDNNFNVDYYPQLYINRISEDFKNPQLQDLIDKSITDTGVYPHIKKVEENKSNYSKNCKDNINLFNNLLVDNKRIEEEIGEIGELEDIEKNIEKIEKNYRDLIKELNISSEEHKIYEMNNEELDKLKKQQLEISNQRSKKKSKIGQISDFMRKIKKIFDSELQDFVKKDLLDVVNEFYENIHKINDDIKQKIVNLSEQENDLKIEIEATNQKLSPILNKMKRRSELEENRKQKEILENTKIQIENSKKIKDKNIIDQKKKLHEIKTNLENVIDLFQITNKQYNGYTISGGLYLQSNLEFDDKNYNKYIFNLFDQRKVSKGIEEGILDPEYQYSEDFCEKWFNFIKGSLEGKYDKYLKKNQSHEDLLTQISILPLIMPKNIIKENDSLDKMSPGKRAIVVLELLLEKSANSKNPILIDQPEDNLDNRSISTELVNLLRKVSLNRQVIIITHNANLVVLSDSDEVIVANQDPNLTENIKYRFEYITGSLENSRSVDNSTEKLLDKGIRNNVTDILEGGVEAFRTRERKYLLK